MSEETLNGAVAPVEAATGPSFTVEKIYAKDVSFEVPGGPSAFNEQSQPQLQMNLSQSVQQVNDGLYEVVLGITLTCNDDEKPLYLAEVKQAGVFSMSGFEPAQLDAMLGIHCPNVLYPYSRALISSLIQSGGFPPFFLQPINFEALYSESLRQRAAKESENTTPGLDGVETAGNA